MPIPFSEADQVYSAPKRLLKPLRWIEITGSRKTDVRTSLEARVEISGAVPRGVYFRIVAHPGSLTRITFQLEVDLVGERFKPALYRFELNPSRDHTNKLYGPNEISGVFIGAGIPHEHRFYDSLKKDGELRSKPDEQGRIVPDPPTDFPTALTYVCGRINITNGADVPPLKIQGNLI
tara:strand:- start:1508 stop:2041 length:534 start_codon:yes stop_codon:yes gene_type:complete